MRTFREWFDEGLSRGFLDEPFCYVHDGPKMTEDEELILEQNEDDIDLLCIVVARLEEWA